MPNARSQRPNVPASVDVIVVGAGLGGLYAHHKFRSLGLKLFGFEAAPEVGGTWFWNRYPGARCDVESLDYTYSFSDELLNEWRWTERFATQPEILRYVNYVADRFDLRRDIAFDTRVTAARFDERTNRWTVETSQGDRTTAQFLVTTVGCLSAPKPPEFAGLEDFTGRWVQTSAWPREAVEIAGKRVAVIGTGSSGIQAIPVIAREAAQLTVFQRTPNFSLPAKNGPVRPEFEAKVRADYPQYVKLNKRTKGGVQPKVATGKSTFEVPEDERLVEMDRAWNYGTAGMQGLYRDILTDVKANEIVAEFVRGKIREIVEDPATAEKLSPRDHPFGTKRLCLDTDYFATFNRPNVELVDIRATPIERITANGVKTSEREREFDLIVFATGFDAMTGPILRMNIEGAGGRRLTDEWRDGPAAYLGLMIESFPNLFTVNGPGSPSVLCNMIPTLEHHVDWIADCIAHMRKGGLERIDVEPAAQEAWAGEVQAVAGRTLYPQAKSWYMGDNVSGKPRMFLAYVGGFVDYTDRCEEVARSGYTGFRLSASRAAALA
jgi:cyclohexanone monooxygenase